MGERDVQASGTSCFDNMDDFYTTEEELSMHKQSSQMHKTSSKRESYNFMKSVNIQLSDTRNKFIKDQQKKTNELQKQNHINQEEKKSFGDNFGECLMPRSQNKRPTICMDIVARKHLSMIFTKDIQIEKIKSEKIKEIQNQIQQHQLKSQVRSRKRIQQRSSKYVSPELIGRWKDEKETPKMQKTQSLRQLSLASLDSITSFKSNQGLDRIDEDDELDRKMEKQQSMMDSRAKRQERSKVMSLAGLERQQSTFGKTNGRITFNNKFSQPAKQDAHCQHHNGSINTQFRMSQIPRIRQNEEPYQVFRSRRKTIQIQKKQFQSKFLNKIQPRSQMVSPNSKGGQTGIGSTNHFHRNTGSIDHLMMQKQINSLIESGKLYMQTEELALCLGSSQTNYLPDINIPQKQIKL